MLASRHRDSGGFLAGDYNEADTSVYDDNRNTRFGHASVLVGMSLLHYLLHAGQYDGQGPNIEELVDSTLAGGSLWGPQKIRDWGQGCIDVLLISPRKINVKPIYLQSLRSL